ncbi:MAG: hypothetical protein FWC03_08850 [Treponema sp.]|nr:hypothetical protein [Treponema sp.]
MNSCEFYPPGTFAASAKVIIKNNTNNEITVNLFYVDPIRDGQVFIPTEATIEAGKSKSFETNEKYALGISIDFYIDILGYERIERDATYGSTTTITITNEMLLFQQ